MHLGIAKKLLQIADDLDNLGFYKEADKLTTLVKTAQMPGWSPSPTVQVPAQQTPVMPPTQPPAPSNQQPPQYPQQYPQQYPGYSAPNLSNINPGAYSQATPYSGSKYAPGGYTGWYNTNNSPVIPAAPNQTAIDSQAIYQQLMNIPANALTAVKTGPDGKQYVQKGPTMQDYVTNFLQSTKNNNSKNTVQNARQLQINQELEAIENRKRMLIQEQQKQQYGDGVKSQ